MSERKVYELARMMSDRNVIEKDMEEAMAAVTEIFRGKYIKRLSDAFGKCRKSCIENPSKELALLQSLKSFTKEENHPAMDEMMEFMILLETFSNIKQEAMRHNKETEKPQAAHSLSSQNKEKHYTNPKEQNKEKHYANPKEQNKEKHYANSKEQNKEKHYANPREQIEKNALPKEDDYMNKPISAASINPKQSSNTVDSMIHPDGIYQVDQNCMVKKNSGIPTQLVSFMLASAISRQVNG